MIFMSVCHCLTQIFSLRLGGFVRRFKSLTGTQRHKGFLELKEYFGKQKSISPRLGGSVRGFIFSRQDAKLAKSLPHSNFFHLFLALLAALCEDLNLTRRRKDTEIFSKKGNQSNGWPSWFFKFAKVW